MASPLLSAFSAASTHETPRLLPSSFLRSQATHHFVLPLQRRQRLCPAFLAAANQPQQKLQGKTGEPAKKRSAVRRSSGEKRQQKLRVPIAEVDSEGPAPATAMPNPPCGFGFDAQGRVVLTANRVVTIVDETNNLPLDCIIRRVFRSSQGKECFLLYPVDTPVQILRSTNFDGWCAVNDDEIESIIPATAYALAKIHMHLVVSGFCYTARGGFCYSEDDILEFGTDDGKDVEGLPHEAVEITCFNLDGSHYMIYTPSDPLLFVATKDENEVLQIADDDLLDDPAIVAAIDEETEFNALVEEEAALLESLLGET